MCPTLAVTTSVENGIAMALATITYWLMRKQLVHIPPKGTGFLKETLSKEGLMVVVKLFFFLYVFVAVFWSLFNQTMSKWVLQAEKMNLTFFNLLHEFHERCIN